LKSVGGDKKELQWLGPTVARQLLLASGKLPWPARPLLMAATLLSCCST
jgi:hypothetical protein